MKIEVGDMVQVWDNNRLKWTDTKYQVLHIHQRHDRVWVTVAYLGDMPTSHALREVRLVPHEFYLKGKHYEIHFVNGKPDWDSVRERV